MSTVVGFPHEFRSNGPRRDRKPHAKHNIAVAVSGGGEGDIALPIALDFDDFDEGWIQKLFAFLAALWERIVALEKQLVAAVERAAGIGAPAAIPQAESYTTAEFADCTDGRLKRETVERYCREGKLLGHKVHGRGINGEYRIPVEEFIRWKDEGLRRPEPVFPRHH